MFLYLGCVCTPPTFVHPHTFVCHQYICMPSGVYTLPICPPYSSVHLYVLGVFACCGGCKGLPFGLGHFPYTTPVWGCLFFICTPHTQLLVPCALVCFGDINMLCGHFPFYWGVWGVFPHQLGGFGGISTWDVHMLILVHFCSALCLMFLLWLPLLLLWLQ